MRAALAAAILLTPIAASAQQKAAAAKGPDLKALDAWITRAMTEWKIPGVAVGIVKDGKVVVSKGYGYRNVEEKLPVTEKTIMAIGSNTKSFTVVLMGKLVDQGKLDWEKPVRNYLPDFRLYDAYATAEMTPRDLVSHSSGLPRHDLLWYGRSWGRKEIYQRLQYLEPTTSFRGRFQYQNPASAPASATSIVVSPGPSRSPSNTAMKIAAMSATPEARPSMLSRRLMA